MNPRKPCNTADEAWSSAREAARRLGISAPVVPKVAAANSIRLRILPGTLTRYSAEDIAKLAASAVQLDGRRKPTRAAS